MLFLTTWIDFEGIMLNEISQTEEDKYHMISLTYGILKQKQNKKATPRDTENSLTGGC